MTTFYSLPYTNFSGKMGNLTISTGPVIIDASGEKVLLHISSSTGKYQFIGGRLDDTVSFRDNALSRAREVVSENLVTLTSEEPLVLFDTIQRNGISEQILLVHYRASIQDERSIGDALWFTIEEIEELARQNKISSPNVLVGSKYFIGK